MSFVYVVSEGANGPVKVGVAKRPRQRLAELQIGNPRKLKLAGSWLAETRSRAIGVEFEVHAEMKRYRLRGEWLDIDEIGACGLVEARLAGR